MKYIILTMVVLGAILGGIVYQKPVAYIAPEVIEKEVEVDALEEAIKSAQNAVSEATEAIGEQAKTDAINRENKKIELQVIKDFSEKLDARQIELEKATNEY